MIIRLYLGAPIWLLLPDNVRFKLTSPDSQNGNTFIGETAPVENEDRSLKWSTMTKND